MPATVAALFGCAVLAGGGAVINAGNPQAGQTVAGVGLGGVGVAALLTSLALVDIKVIGVDAVAEKLRQAPAIGSRRVLTRPRSPSRT